MPLTCVSLCAHACSYVRGYEHYKNLQITSGAPIVSAKVGSSPNDDNSVQNLFCLFLCSI